MKHSRDYLTRMVSDHHQSVWHAVIIADHEAIESVGNRIDGMNERLDRAFEHTAAPARRRTTYIPPTVADLNPYP
jgi:hypothetical protein